MRPGFVFRLLEYWLFSRVPTHFLLGLPAAVIAGAGILFLLRLQTNDQRGVIRDYQLAASEAVRNEEWHSASLYLQSLCALQPSSSAHKFQLAVLYHQLGNEPRALGLMRQIAPLDGGGGFAPAQIWFAKQALAGEIPDMSGNELGHRLQAAVRMEPSNPTANALLADWYVSENQFRLAETHLRIAAEQDPEMYLSLARLQKQLERSSELINQALEAASTAFRQRLAADASDVTARCHWAECHAFAQQYKEAESILREGLLLEDRPNLRTALSQLYVEIANVRLRNSPLNVDLARRLLVQSLAISPANLEVITQLSKLPAARLSIPQQDLEIPLTYWLEQLQEDNQSSARIAVAHLLKICGRTGEAIQRLEHGLDEHPESRALLAHLYAEADRMEESDLLYNQLLKEIDEHPDQSQIETDHARVLLLLRAGRLEEAIAGLSTVRDEMPETERISRDRLRNRILVAMVDRLLSGPTDASEQALDLLEDCVSAVPQDQQPLIKIARISCSNLSAAAEADELLNKILAVGSFNATVYNLIGTEALRKNQFEKARRNLETAKRLEPQNPMVLNNLALAHVRGPVPDFEYSLSLAETVLQLLPENPDALGTRAEILLAMERLEEANRDLQLALPDRPSSQTLRRLLVTVNERLGNQDLAQQHREILHRIQNAED